MFSPSISIHSHFFSSLSQKKGKRKSVESFIRWCKRGDVGLSQSVKVQEVIDEFPTGLYDDFYVDTGRAAEVGGDEK